jgi:hypothetical protein
VAEVATWQGEPEVIILHIEVEGRGALWARQTLPLRYGQVGLRDLAAEGYLQQLEPVAASLATLMRAESERRAAIKLQALRTVAASDLPEGVSCSWWN